MSLIDYLKSEQTLLSTVTGNDERRKPVQANQPDSKQERDTPIISPESMIAPVELSPVTLKPPTMPEEDWQTALSVFAPERIKEIYGAFNPDSVKPFYENLYQSVYNKPSEPDERQMAAGRSMAGIGDALSLIAQSVAAAKGSFIEKRNPQEDATAKTDVINDKLRESYRRSLYGYNAGYWGARAKDVDGAHGDYQRDRAALLALLAKHREDLQKDKKFNGEMVYKYQKMYGDDDDKKARLKLQADANQIKRDNLAWQREKYKLPKKDTPRGYLDFYDSTTGMTYRVADKKWKANFTQIFDRVKNDLYKKYPLLQSQERLGSLKPVEKEEYVKQYVYDNPKALRFLENIAETKFQDGKPEPVVQLPKVSTEQYNAISSIAGQYKKDDAKALSSIARYLKNEGFKQDEIITLLKTMQDE